MIDITKTINEKIDIYPGDPEVIINRVKNIENDGFNLSSVNLSNHTGTHIDFPSHVLRDGQTINDYPLDYLCGEGLVLDFSQNKSSTISKDILADKDIFEKDIVIIKHSRKNKDIYIDSSAIQFLAMKDIKAIGTESFSIDTACSEDLLVHKGFLSKGILIIEHLDLSKITAGRYKIYIFPMKLDLLDGSPCRVGVEKC